MDEHKDAGLIELHRELHLLEQIESGEEGMLRDGETLTDRLRLRDDEEKRRQQKRHQHQQLM